MAAGAGGDDDDQSEPTDEAVAAAESAAEQTDSSNVDERANIADANAPRNDGTRTSSALTGVTTLGVTGVATESARRLGIERHAEAGFAEQAHAEAYAKKIGGTVIDDGTSAFAPDGGIDKIVETPSGRRLVQSKHYGRPVGESLLEQYAGEVDVIGATNGVTENIDPAAHDLEVITTDHWPWHKHLGLQGRRVLRGFSKAISPLKIGVRAVVSGFVGLAKFLGRLAVAVGKWFCRVLIAIGVVIGKWFLRRSPWTQLLLIFAVIGLLYLLWRWYTAEEEETVDADADADPLDPQL